MLTGKRGADVWPNFNWDAKAPIGGMGFRVQIDGLQGNLIPNIHRPEEFRCPSSPFGAVRSQGLTTMVQNIVAGLVVVALIVIGSISYAQKHHHCEQGYVLKHWRAHALKKTQETCGSMSPSI